jgi:hypothetical protein
VSQSQVTPNAGGFQLSGVIVRDIAGATVIGTKDITVASTAGEFKVQAVADGTNLAIQVKGLKDELVKWTARVEVTPVT